MGGVRVSPLTVLQLLPANCRLDHACVWAPGLCLHRYDEASSVVSREGGGQGQNGMEPADLIKTITNCGKASSPIHRVSAGPGSGGALGFWFFIAEFLV